MGSSCFIIEFVFDFRKDNFMILVIRSLFPYQRPILLDFWQDHDFGNKISLSLSKTTSALLRINVFEENRIWILEDP